MNKMLFQTFEGKTPAILHLKYYMKFKIVTLNFIHVTCEAFCSSFNLSSQDFFICSISSWLRFIWMEIAISYNQRFWKEF